MESGIKRLLPESFPPLLQEIPDAPKHLFIRGEFPSPQEYKYLCVVGSRSASQYGHRVCTKLISELSGMPVVIVSGLALGIDAQAHKGALESGLKTIAVLPSGLDDHTIYPAMNRNLAGQILKTGGALISEYGMGEKPQQWMFPARNRIMAGLSNATLIIEASEKSGTLITARLTLDYNHEVLCVPHPIGSESGTGNNRLIREGAILVRNADDILEVLGLRKNTDPRELPSDLNEFEQKIMYALTEPLHKDELIERADVSAQSANIALSSLSIRGLITERFGKIERL